MKIQHREFDGKNGEFFILDVTEKKIAELTYFYENDTTINANHTFVDESLQGQGIAAKLYNALVEFVRARQLTLHPTCSYIAKKWEREQ